MALRIVSISLVSFAIVTILSQWRDHEANAENVGNNDKVKVKSRRLEGNLAEFKMNLPPNASILASEGFRQGRNTYYAIKYLDGKDIISKIVDEVGEEVQIKPDRQVESSWIGDNLMEELLKTDGDSNRLKIVLSLEEEDSAVEDEEGEVKISNGRLKSLIINKREISESDLKAIDNKKSDNIILQQKKREEKRKTKFTGLSHTLKDLEPSVHEAIEAAKERGDRSVEFTISKGKLKNILSSLRKFSDAIDVALEVNDESLDSAMTATGIKAYALPFSNRRGAGVTAYQTEVRCSPNTGEARYWMIADNANKSTVLDHTINVKTIFRTVAPGANLYCKAPISLPSSTDLAGYQGLGRIQLVNLSAGFEGTTNSYTTYDRDWDDFVYNNYISVFKSAGNNGNNGLVNAPGNASNVITVGNFDDATGQIHVTSSGIEFQAEKPDLSAPGVAINAGGYTKTGTSQATPHATGFAADIIGSTWGQFYTSRPEALKSLLLAGSIYGVSGDYEAVGYAWGLNFLHTYFDSSSQYWNGTNSSFATYDASDPYPNNNCLDYKVYMDQSVTWARVAMAFGVRGTWTWSRRAYAPAIGADYDLHVYDPNGNPVGFSVSTLNAQESVAFDPTVTGDYRICVSRYSNTDTSARVRVGVSVHTMR